MGVCREFHGVADAARGERLLAGQQVSSPFLGERNGRTKMGVPAFYRWLSEKYPKIVVDMLEDRTVRVEGTEIPLDLTAANPNGIEVSKRGALQ